MECILENTDIFDEYIGDKFNQFIKNNKDKFIKDTIYMLIVSFQFLYTKQVKI